MGLREPMVLTTTAMKNLWQPICPSLRGEQVNGVTWLVQMVRFPRTENVRARVFPELICFYNC